MNSEYDDFNNAIDTILKADPKVVRQQMQQDAKDREEARKAKRASSAPGPDDQA